MGRKGLQLYEWNPFVTYICGYGTFLFGYPLSMSDLSILEASPNIKDMLAGIFPTVKVQYTLCGDQVNWF